MLPTMLSLSPFRRLVVVVAVALAATIGVARAGAPLMCHKFQIGDAPSLPWGADTFGRSESYDVARVVPDTLELLDDELPVLARMETMRRAATYIGRDQSRAESLLGALLTRALDSEVVMDPRLVSLRYFDAGYLAATFAQAGIETRFGPADGDRKLHGSAPGYAWLVRAWKLSGGADADIATAIALVTVDTRMTEHTMFMEKAVQATSTDDTARADTLQWIAQIKGTTLDAIRARVTDARSDR